MKRSREDTANTRVGRARHGSFLWGANSLVGTWIPLEKGITVARKYNVYDVLKPIFEFVPGDKSPPPAPKHTTAAAGKPKVPKSAVPRKVASEFSHLVDNET